MATCNVCGAETSRSLSCGLPSCSIECDDKINSGGYPDPIQTGTSESTLTALRTAESLFKNFQDHIVSDPEILGGTPVVKGSRLPVHTIHNRLVQGDTIEDLLRDYPYLTREAIESAVGYAVVHPADQVSDEFKMIRFGLIQVKIGEQIGNAILVLLYEGLSNDPKIGAFFQGQVHGLRFFDGLLMCTSVLRDNISEAYAFSLNKGDAVVLEGEEPAITLLVPFRSPAVMKIMLKHYRLMP